MEYFTHPKEDIADVDLTTIDKPPIISTPPKEKKSSQLTEFILLAILVTLLLPIVFVLSFH